MAARLPRTPGHEPVAVTVRATNRGGRFGSTPRSPSREGPSAHSGVFDARPPAGGMYGNNLRSGRHRKVLAGKKPQEHLWQGHIIAAPFSMSGEQGMTSGIHAAVDRHGGDMPGTRRPRLKAARRCWPSRLM